MAWKIELCFCISGERRLQYVWKLPANVWHWKFTVVMNHFESIKILQGKKCVSGHRMRLVMTAKKSPHWQVTVCFCFMCLDSGILLSEEVCKAKRLTSVFQGERQTEGSPVTRNAQASKAMENRHVLENRVLFTFFCFTIFNSFYKIYLLI